MGEITDLSFGSKSNIWQMGLIMWCLQHGQECVYDWDEMILYKSDMMTELWENPDDEGDTVGTEEDEADEQEEEDDFDGYTFERVEDDDDEQDDFDGPKIPTWAYSKSLKSLIKECLLIRSEIRPTAEWLVMRTREGLEAARLVNGNMLPGAPAISVEKAEYPDPKLSAKWSSGQTEASTWLASVDVGTKATVPQAPSSAVEARIPGKWPERRRYPSRPLAKSLEPPRSQLPFNLREQARAAQLQPQPRKRFRSENLQFHFSFQEQTPAAQPQPQPRKRFRSENSQLPAQGGQTLRTQQPQPRPPPSGLELNIRKGIIKDLEISVYEPGAQSKRKMIFHDVDLRTTFSNLKTMLIQSGCTIPREKMRFTTMLKVWANQQLLGEMDEFERLTLAVDDGPIYNYT